MKLLQRLKTTLLSNTALEALIVVLLMANLGMAIYSWR